MSLKTGGFPPLNFRKTTPQGRNQPGDQERFNEITQQKRGQPQGKLPKAHRLIQDQVVQEI